MTQSTDAYAVANGSGAAVRAALNADLQAVNSSNSGASAATTDIWTDGSRNRCITGTTTITAFSNTGFNGQLVWVLFAASLTLTHNASSLICVGGQNIVTQAGDSMLMENLGSGNARMLDYQRASGQPVIVPPIV